MDNYSSFDIINAVLGPQQAQGDEQRLLRAIAGYLDPADAANVQRAITYLHALRDARSNSAQPATTDNASAVGAVGSSLDGAVSYAVGIALTLADALHIDAVTLGAVLIYPAVKSHAVTVAQVRRQLGGVYGEQVARTMGSIERFDALQRPGAALRRSAQARTEAAGEELDRERRRSIERRKAQDADALRKMFLAMAEDPRVVIIKIADQLRLLRAMREAADYWRVQAGEESSHASIAGIADAAQEAEAAGGDDAADATYSPEHPSTAWPEGVVPPWSLEDCRLQAEETREIYAPLAGRLGMGRVEGELEDLAFAILEPDEYRWLSEAVEEEIHERAAYVERVSTQLRREMLAVGLNAEVSGRVKHLYSIDRKVKRSGGRDLSNLFDILAFRIIVNTLEECYIALGRVHERWRPKDGRIKDFIAAPKPNGYQSLHTTIFCLDGRLAEIQIRTREMHQLAEYGVAMHWYYKDAGDTASAKARPLQAWLQQVQEWQAELQSPSAGNAKRAVEAVKGDVLKEQIFLFTPAGDVKELPAGSTPIDFAYRIHSDLGHRVAGARVTTDDGTGRLVKRMVPLDYELKGGDVIEIITRHDAHPTRDWLKFARTKMARTHISRYLKAHERDIDLQMGRERLDRELKLLGLRKGLEEFPDAELGALASELDQGDADSLLVAIGRESLRMTNLLSALRERLKALLPPEPEQETPTSERLRETETGASVAGLAGMLARPGNCCSPLPGDDIRGYITRGRGVVIHRSDCPNLRHLIAREPERAVSVEWPATLDGKQVVRARIVVEAHDRPGLLRDVTGAVTNHKINMAKVETTTQSRTHVATITATLELQRPEQLDEILGELRTVQSVMMAERLVPGRRRGEGTEETEDAALGKKHAANGYGHGAHGQNGKGRK
ncbi:MAG TPA: TGS domain-containing protein [Ktedonobacterales bacterium]